MDNKCTKQQIKRFHTLLRAINVPEHKQTILEANGVESTKDLTYTQLDTINDELQRMSSSKYEVPRSTRKLRSQVLDQLTVLQVYDEKLPAKQKWKKVNAYLREPRIAGKLLYECSDEELQTLVRKLRAIVKKQNESAEADNIMAIWN